MCEKVCVSVLWVCVSVLCGYVCECVVSVCACATKMTCDMHTRIRVHMELPVHIVDKLRGILTKRQVDNMSDMNPRSGI